MRVFDHVPVTAMSRRIDRPVERCSRVACVGLPGAEDWHEFGCFDEAAGFTVSRC